MRFSDSRRSELEYAVFTNSDGDYRVTSISTHMPSEAGHVLDAIARGCHAWRAEGCDTLIGVIPLPHQHDRVFAFRLFDVGHYRGRDHTLGIVGILVPVARYRAWALGDMVAALRPPVPGSDRYPTPGDDVEGAAKRCGEPYVALNAWDRQHPDGPSGIEYWSSPKGFSPVLPTWPMPTEKDTPMRKRHLMKWWVILMALVVVAIVIIIVSTRLNWASVQNGDAHDQTSPPASGVTKQEIQDALRGIVSDDSWAVEPAASLDILEHRVIEIAEQAGERMRTLHDKLHEIDEREDDPKYLHTALEIAFDKWTPINAGPMAATHTNPNTSQVRQALVILQDYKQARNTVKALTYMEATQVRFREGVLRLQLDLERHNRP